MTDKLQELTDKLYNEGLSKGKTEGEKILQEAKAQADKVKADAKSAAEKTLKKAEADAEALKQKAASDIKMASEQCLAATKKDIENLVTAKIVDAKVDAALADGAFVKEAIKAVAEKFSVNSPAGLNVILPEKMKSSMEGWVKTELAKELKTDVTASFSKKISGGFTIGPKDGSYFISLTDDTFKELISEYLRPVTRKILFGE